MEFHREWHKATIKWPKLLSLKLNHLKPWNFLSCRNNLQSPSNLRKINCQRRFTLASKFPLNIASKPFDKNDANDCVLQRLKPAKIMLSLWVIFMHESLVYNMALASSWAIKVTFNIAWAENWFIFSVDWLLRYISENVLLCSFFFCRSSLMVRKQWPEKLTKSIFFNWMNYGAFAVLILWSVNKGFRRVGTKINFMTLTAFYG